MSARGRGLQQLKADAKIHRYRCKIHRYHANQSRKCIGKYRSTGL